MWNDLWHLVHKKKTKTKKHTYVSNLHCWLELVRPKSKELRGHAPLAALSIAFWFMCYCAQLTGGRSLYFDSFCCWKTQPSTEWPQNRESNSNPSNPNSNPSAIPFQEFTTGNSYCTINVWTLCYYLWCSLISHWACSLLKIIFWSRGNHILECWDSFLVQIR